MLQLNGKNQNFKYLFCPKGRGYGSFFKKLPEPFNTVKSLPLGHELHIASLYYAKGFTNSLNSSINIRKCIMRFINLKVDDKKLGYIIYDKQTGDLYTGYWDGTCEEYAEYVNGEVKEPATNRTIHMHSHLEPNRSYQQIDSAFISENNFSIAYKIGDNSSEHTACAYLFHALCQSYFEPDNMATHEPQIVSAMDKLIEGYEIYKSGTYGDEFIDRYGELLTFLENELYVNFGCDYEGQSPMFPFAENKPTEELIEKVRNDSDSICWCNESKNIKNAKVVKLKVKKILDVGEYVNSGEYLIGDYKFENNDEELVPKRYDHYIPNDMIKQTLEIIKNNNSLPEPAMLNFLFQGEAGTGKSVGSQMIARMCGLPYRFLTLSANSQEDDLYLNILPGTEAGTFIHEESEFVKTFEYGGVIEIQEANTPKNDSVLTSLNCALDDTQTIQLKNGKVIKRHPNCIVVFTINRGYNGTHAMNQSVLSRLTCKFTFDLPANVELIRNLVDKSGISEDDASKMVKAMFDIQKVLNEEGEDNGVCSFRELVNWAKLYKLLGDVHQSAEISIINSSSNDSDTIILLKQVICNYFA